MGGWVWGGWLGGWVGGGWRGESGGGGGPWRGEKPTGYAASRRIVVAEMHDASPGHMIITPPPPPLHDLLLRGGVVRPRSPGAPEPGAPEPRSPEPRSPAPGEEEKDAHDEANI